MIKEHLPGREGISNYKDFNQTVGKAMILVSLCLAFLVTNPVADDSFDDLPSTLERMISPLLRGDSGVCLSRHDTPRPSGIPLKRGSYAMLVTFSGTLHYEVLSSFNFSLRVLRSIPSISAARVLLPFTLESTFFICSLSTAASVR